MFQGLRCFFTRKSLLPWVALWSICPAFGVSGLVAQTPAPAVPTPPPNPCPTTPDFRQLDFWLGDWDVTSQGRKVGTSKIERIIGDCVILENYNELTGYSGKSFNFFDTLLGKWRETWVDSTGGVSEFTGEFKNGTMQLSGETHRADGGKILRKMLLSPAGVDRVRQFSEKSTDNGKTWTTAYDFIYVRKPKP
jgi:hypothetical protein